jgi:DNA-binding winged helix-turn-helix (wHTH) protein
MQAVWLDSFVEEANLTLWISVLRKTLGEGEDARPSGSVV